MSETDAEIHKVPRLGLRRGAIVFAMLWLTFVGVHYQTPGWNVNIRFNLTRAIVEKGTLILDDYVNRPNRDEYTEDRSIKNGHYYSDKIIGTTLLGIPPYALAKLGAWLVGKPLSIPLARYLTTIFSISVLAALAGTAMMSLLLAFGARVNEAFLLMIAMSFGTMLWGYSALFCSYLPMTCFSLFSYNVLLRGRLEGGLDERALVVSGLCLGASLLCEYTVGILAVILSGYVVWHARPRWRVLLFWLYAAIPMAVSVWYTLACFREVCFSYKYEEAPIFRMGMSQGLQGVAHFRLAVLYFITLHPYRGLFVLSPVLALSLAGLARMMWKERGAAGCFMSDAWLCGLIFAGYLWFNSSYYMWWGGAALGPRHLIPALPFLIPPLLYFLRWHYRAAALLGLALAASIWLVAVPTLVEPQAPEYYDYRVLTRMGFADSRYIVSPLFHWSWPMFFHAQSAWNRATPYTLRGPWYLIVLSLVWCFGAIALLRTPKTEDGAKVGEPHGSPDSTP